MLLEPITDWEKYKEELPQHLGNDNKIIRHDKKDWEEITEDVFKKMFQKLAVKRAKSTGLKLIFIF